MTPGVLETFTGWFSANPAWLATGLFLIAFLESLAIAGLVIPGVAILFAVAALAGKAGVPLGEALMWAGAGAILGDGLSYCLGRQLKGRLHSVWPFSRYPRMLQRGEHFFMLHGGKSVVIGRFLGPIRPVLPLIAGAFRMPSRRFFTFNILSAIGWAPVYVLPGYLVGSALASDIKLPPQLYPVIGLSVAILAAIYLVFFRLRWGLDNESRLYNRLRRWTMRYNATHQFWRSFSSARPAQGGEFPLGSLSLGLGAGALFAIWATLNLATDLLGGFDQQVASFFSSLRQPLLDSPALFFTLLGDIWPLSLGALLAIAVFAFRGYYAAAIHVAAGLLITSVTVTGLKASFAVGRPELVATLPDSWAFPSGHATSIAMFSGLAASFVAREFSNRKRWQVYLAFSLPMLLVAGSRLFLGVHWFTDVVGGTLLGLSLCGFLRASYSRYDHTPLKLDSSTIIAILLWLVGLAVYLVLKWPEAVVGYAPLNPSSP
ncbi:MAG: bifunctional DedA family/phosphatase PAP2 family protein [Marinobacter sp.]|uniref:bifunctional DedA family/phosphatase PAP2 family protein n=1 Tax=Marinobacter sp. TaxID=50741 RepID=UPI00349FDB57